MSKNILVFCETEAGAPRKSALELLSKGRELAAALGASLSAMVIGAADATTLGSYGATTVYAVSGDASSTEGVVTAVQGAVSASGATVVLASASALARDAFPRLSARIGAGLVVECTDLRVDGGRVVARRPIYAGKALADVEVRSAIALYTTRPNSFPLSASGGAAAAVVAVSPAASAGTTVKLVEVLAPAGATVDLTEAERIVSGGRSLKSKEQFDAVVRPLAASARATPGASRAAVDAGYAGHGDQVGQTGKVVNPTLYIALGISGAIQHLAGMRTSRVIVAVNKDPEAPIFQHASYGIVADLFEVAPALQKEFQKALL